MIEWKKYGQTRETQPESHVPHLATNGKFVVIGVHEIDIVDRVYKWFTDKGYSISGVTHYAEINLPKAIGTTASPSVAAAVGLGQIKE